MAAKVRDVKVQIQYLEEEFQVDELATRVRSLLAEKDLNEDTVELVRLNGLLSFRNKLWRGKIAIVDLHSVLPTSNDDNASSNAVAQDGEKEILLTYVVASVDFAMRVPQSVLSGAFLETLAFPLLSWRVVFILHKGKDVDVSSLIKQNIWKHDKMVFCKKNPLFSPENRPIRGIFASTTWWNGAEDFYNSEERFLRTKILCMTLLPKEKSLTPYTVHDGYEIRELSEKDVLFAMQNYQYSSEFACHTYVQSAKLGLAIGAFPNGSVHPVSWVFCNEKGSLGALVTLESHRRKGLGKAVVGRLSQKLIDIGIIPFAFIESSEDAKRPIGLFQSLGFEIVDYSSWSISSFLN